MVAKILTRCLLVILLGLGQGCSSEQLYATGQSYQRNQCLKLPDQGEREQCLSKADTRHDDYHRESGTDGK